MPNHFHLFLRTPQPNLSRGMQYLVSGYANWYTKRHRRLGHLTQGRFKAALVEDGEFRGHRTHLSYIFPGLGSATETFFSSLNHYETPTATWAGFVNRVSSSIGLT